MRGRGEKGKKKKKKQKEEWGRVVMKDGDLSENGPSIL
jgi:hypothetical protein